MEKILSILAATVFTFAAPVVASAGKLDRDSRIAACDASPRMGPKACARQIDAEIRVEVGIAEQHRKLVQPATQEELAEIKNQTLVQAQRGREVAFAECRIAAYTAQASSIDDFSIACMIVKGWKVGDTNADTMAASFEWYCAPDRNRRLRREGWCE